MSRGRKGRVSLEEFVENVRQSLDAHEADAIALRRRIHLQPELAWAEEKTASAVTEALAPLTVEQVAGTGLLVRVGDMSLPAIALRAELDALPIVERSGSPFASTNGAMHACGHDVHVAALTLLVRAFAATASTCDPPAALVAIFQPSEETSPSGARSVIESGQLDAHQIRAVAAAHVHSRVPWGVVTTGNGAINAGADSFTIVVTGFGGHGGYPHRTHDPVLALSQIVVSLQHIISRRLDPMHPAVLSVTRLNAGTAANVIPDYAEAHGTLRLLDRGDRATALELMTTAAQSVAAAYGCEARVDVEEGDPVLVNDSDLVAAVEPWLTHFGLRTAEPMRSCGADDFSFYGNRSPSLMMFVGVEGHCGTLDGESGTLDEGDHEPGLHHARFLPDEGAIALTARAMLAAWSGAVTSL